MIDIKEFTEKVEELNGIYLKSLERLGLKKDNQEHFLKEVRNIFDSKVNSYDGDHVKLYHFIIQKAYYMLQKSRRNMVSKHNKKIIRNRGNVVWDSKNGMKRNED